MSAKNRIVKKDAVRISTLSETEYDLLITEIEKLVVAGNGTINEDDLPKYACMAKAAQEYEHHVYSPVANV